MGNSTLLIRKWFQYHISLPVRPVFSSLTILLFKAFHYTDAQDVSILPPGSLSAFSTLHWAPAAPSYGLHPLDSLVLWISLRFSQWKYWQKVGGQKEREIGVIHPPDRSLPDYTFWVSGFHVSNSPKATALTGSSPLPCPFMPGSSYCFPHLLAQGMLHHPLLIFLSPVHIFENSSPFI